MNQSHNARRAVSADDVVEIEASTPTSARRGSRTLALSRRVVAATLAGTLSAAALFAFAFNSRGSDADAVSEALSADLAVPAAAAQAAQMGFADRSQEVTRSTVRNDLTAAIADENSKERSEVLSESVESAAAEAWKTNATLRDQLMDEDMVLVQAQADKLKKEAEEAARKLEEARKAAAAMGVQTTEDLSEEDIANLTSSAGSMPLKSGFRMGAGFGARGSWSRYHTGQDFPAPSGTPIYAVASGVVLSSTAGGWAGTNVVLQHSNGGSTLYAHMSQKVVSPGQTVKAGQLIGYVGNTGRSFGAHLHLEYYQPGVTPGDVYSASNPISFIRSLGVNI